MLKTRKFTQDIEVQTITIPKGTILFRGLNFDGTRNHMPLFHDMTGHPGDGYRIIKPTTNVFFYPLPYVSDSVSIFNVHVMYITQYDLELLLLIKPSDMTRNSRFNEIYKEIFDTSGTDDPVLSETFRMRLTDVDGYIALAENDTIAFDKQIKKFININIEKAKQQLPAIAENSRKVTGIPEIVLHPFHYRHDSNYPLPCRFYDSEVTVEYLLKHRAQYNYFPLLYFCNNGIFNFKQLANKDILAQISKDARTYNKTNIPPIYDNIFSVFDSMLQGEKGYTINNTNFKALVDSRTGFYKMKITKNKNIKIKKKKNNHWTTAKAYKYNFNDDWTEGFINSVIVQPKSFKLNNIFLRHKDYIYFLTRDLAENGHSLKRTVVPTKDNIKRVYYKYDVHKALNRPDLSNTNKKGYRNPALINKTIKNTKGAFSYFYNSELFSKEEIKKILNNNSSLYTNEELAELQKYDDKD
jgi:hypothetical protein